MVRYVFPCLSKSSDGTSLVITSRALGQEVSINSITVNPSALASGLGLFNVNSGLPIRGVTHPSYERELTRQPIWQQVLPGDFWVQSGANEGDGMFLNIPFLNATVLGLLMTNAITPPEAFGLGLGVSYVFDETKPSTLSVSNHEDAARAITIANTAINRVSSERAKIGAMSNRLEYKMAGVDISHENLTASESRIRDADLAKEYTGFVKTQILTQSSTAMLAQANAIPQSVLQLLG